MRPADIPIDPSRVIRPNDRRPHGVPQAIVDRFTLALRAAIATGATHVPALREAVTMFAHAMRTTGSPPEQTVIAVKERIQAALLRRPDVERSDASELLRRVVSWAIEGYYRAD